MKKVITCMMVSAEFIYANPWARSLTLVDKAIQHLQPQRRIVVAVIDTGVDTNHEKLKANIWKNEGELGLDSNGHDKSTNKKDDDGNGYIDDVHGWNFHAQKNTVDDFHGHGTHVSGIILGITSKEDKPIQEIIIMPLKYIEPDDQVTNTLSSSIQAFEYAIQMGAHIINYSAGGSEYSEQEKKVMMKAQKEGILVVAAAGNESENSDRIPYYPASYSMSNIISVTAVDEKTQLIPVANYGTHNVHIAAPGYKIFSSLPKNRYGYMTGTSQATAFVSGIAALTASQIKGPPQADKIKEKLLVTSEEKDQLIGLSQMGSIVNALFAVTQVDTGVNANGDEVLITESQDQFSSDIEKVFFANKSHLRSNRSLVSQK